ncbi:MAG: cell shape-determining protein MreC [Candidatus Nanohaloarchaea archaeon]|jgi:cell shape-determining protein MreC
MSGKSSRERITDTQEAIEELEDRVENLGAKIDEKKEFLSQIESHQKNSKKQAKAVRESKKQVNSDKEEIENLKSEIKDTKKSLNKELNNAEVKKEDIDKFFTKVFGEENDDGKREGGLKNRLENKEDELDEYIEDSKQKVDDFLDEHEQKYQEIEEEIESLLPGATATGLASAFFEQKNDYNFPKAIWSAVFFFAIGGLVLTGKLHSQQIGDLYSAFQNLLTKLPYLIAFVWLGTFAGRRFKENRRLQEEYAHKEALAKTYIGYEEDFSDNKNASELLDKALIDAFSKNPGELLDNVPDDDKPGVFSSLEKKLKKSENE